VIRGLLRDGFGGGWHEIRDMGLGVFMIMFMT
jgi:hypothetical protein